MQRIHLQLYLDGLTPSQLWPILFPSVRPYTLRFLVRLPSSKSKSAELKSYLDGIIVESQEICLPENGQFLEVILSSILANALTRSFIKETKLHRE